MDAQLESRHIDLAARWLRAQGHGFYTIGSAGHESNAAVAAALRPTDPALLHYRSGGFYCARARQVEGIDPVRDILQGMFASVDEPIAGGRHKVFGRHELAIIPQTSTIASHLPRAVGIALTIGRAPKLPAPIDWPLDALTVCSFGDASANHSTAVGAINTACHCAHSRLPLPLLLVCEDNGIGISVRTPGGWIEAAYAHLVGTQNFFLYIYDEPELIRGVLDGLAEYYAALGCNAVKLGVDMIRVGDDVGAQQAMMMSPKSWRELAKPRFQYMFEQFKKVNPDIFLKFHSCGDYSQILGDEVDLGADLSGLMQPAGGLKDQQAIKQKYGADIALCGGFDVQRLLPRGQVEDVRKGVHDVMKNLGPGGGYIFSPSHYIMADVPIQNIMAMFEAQKDFGVYGKYPLN